MRVEMLIEGTQSRSRLFGEISNEEEEATRLLLFHELRPWPPLVPTPPTQPIEASPSSKPMIKAPPSPQLSLLLLSLSLQPLFETDTTLRPSSLRRVRSNSILEPPSTRANISSNTSTIPMIDAPPSPPAPPQHQPSSPPSSPTAPFEETPTPPQPSRSTPPSLKPTTPPLPNLTPSLIIPSTPTPILSQPNPPVQLSRRTRRRRSGRSTTIGRAETRRSRHRWA